MKSLIWQSVMWRPGKVRFLVRMKNRSISGRPRPPANAPLTGPRRSPDSQRQSGYALLPSRIRRHFLIQIDAASHPDCRAARIAMRADKTDQSFAALIYLAAAV